MKCSVVQQKIVTNKNIIFIIGALPMSSFFAYTAVDPFIGWRVTIFLFTKGHLMTISFDVGATLLFGTNFIDLGLQKLSLRFFAPFLSS